MTKKDAFFPILTILTAMSALKAFYMSKCLSSHINCEINRQHQKKKHELPRDFLIHVRNNSVISIPLAYLFYPIFGLNCPSNSMHINNFADE